MTDSPSLNADFSDLLCELIDHQVRFVVVGAHAMAAHGIPRATGDLDVFYEPERINAEALMGALRSFGAPVEAHGVSEVSLTVPGTIYQLGLPPRRIDLISGIDGVTFREAWASRILVQVDSLAIPIIGIDALIKNKMSTGRDKDELDARLIRQIRSQVQK